MLLHEAVDRFLDYHRANSKPNTVRSYEPLLCTFVREVGKKDTNDVSSEEIYSFIMRRGKDITQGTRNLYFTLVKAFFSFCRNVLLITHSNPCDDPLLRKAFRVPKPSRKTNVSKAVVDEVIFRTPKVRDRLILELQARSGLRIGEVLKLKVRGMLKRIFTPVGRMVFCR